MDKKTTLLRRPALLGALLLAALSLSACVVADGPRGGRHDPHWSNDRDWHGGGPNWQGNGGDWDHHH